MNDPIADVLALLRLARPGQITDQQREAAHASYERLTSLHAPDDVEVLAEPDCYPWVASCEHPFGCCPVTTLRVCRECTRLAGLAGPEQAPVVEYPCPTVTAVLADPVGEATRALTP